MPSTAREQPFHVGRMLIDLMSGQITNPDVLHLRLKNPNINPMRPEIPWDAFVMRHDAARADDVAGSLRRDVAAVLGLPRSAANLLLRDITQTDSSALLEPRKSAVEAALRPVSVVTQMGVDVREISGPVPSIPRMQPAGAMVWQATDFAQIDVTSVDVDEIAVLIKQGGIVTRLSRQMMLQISDEPVRREMISAIGTGIDTALLNGPGIQGQPQGLLHTLTAADGADMAYADVVALKRAVIAAGAPEANLRVLASPDVQEVLSARQRATGAGFIWDGGRVADVPATASAIVPEGTFIVGDFSKLALIVQGGIAVEFNPYTREDFRTGLVQFRCLAGIDVAVLQPTCFAVADGVT